VGDGQVLVWDPADPGNGPVELGRHDGAATAVAVLPGGRVVSGGGDGRVLVWDPAEPGTGPVELGRHDDGVYAVAVLPDGRVVTGGRDHRVRLWDVRSSSPGSLLACSAYALATSLSPSGARLFIGHAWGGISCWEMRAATQNTPGVRQHAE
jgi:WD40 repeat protein